MGGAFEPNDEKTSDELHYSESQVTPKITPELLMYETKRGSIVQNTESQNNNAEAGTGPVSFEEILQNLGCFGPFQVLTLCTYLTLEIGAAFIVFIPVFVGRTITEVNCTDKNVTLLDNVHENQTTHSSLSEDFQKLLESPFKFESVVDEWNLTCDRAIITGIFTSCLNAGMIFGNVIFGTLSDWYGRRKIVLVVIFLMFLATLLSAFSPNIYFYAVARFFSGAAFNGYINVTCMAVLEFMTPKWRSLANCVGPMGEGIILLSVVAYYVRPWRMLYLATLAPYILILPIYFFLPESPRWLLRNKKMTEAHSVLCYMAKVNGRAPVTMEVLETLRKQEELASASQQAKKISYCEFLRCRPLFIKSLYFFAIWFAWNVTYYGITYNIRNVEGNIYINLGLVGVANAIGQRISMPMNEKLGRRKSLLGGMCLAAVFLIGLAICFLTMEEVSPVLILTACCIGVFGMSWTRCATKLLSGESFPTAVRTMALGVGGLGANIAGILTPQVVYLGTLWPVLPFFIFAGISLAGSLVVFRMKETTGNPLTDEFQPSGDKKKKSEKA